MENYTKTMTAWTPSFGMPAHASAAACAAGVVIRDRHLGDAVWTTDVVRVVDTGKRALPGTSAWSPPTC